ncbi:UNVERIFIED_CONTAM: hypothetical protein FKN15_001914 [Acipenser sinensis]
MSVSGSDVCSHVKVVVRVRPENQKEAEGNFRTVVHVVDNHMLVFDPKEQEVSFFRGQKIKSRDINKRANKDLKFVFDNVFGGNSTQQEVFENTTKGLLDGVLNGYNCTVLAYGATGAGKTHTMLGSPYEPGVMYLTMKELYNRIEQVKDDKTFDIAVSYLEATCKRERRMAALATHRLHMKRKLKDVQQRFEENDNWLHRVENEMRLLGQDAQIPKMLQKDLDCHHSQLEVLDLKQRIEHITYLIGLQDQENKQTEKILNSLLPAFRRQYETLKEAGLASFMVESEFKELEHLVLRERGVVWADQPVPEEPQQHTNSQQELSSIISFSHLVCHQNTPCSAERHKRKSLRKGRLVEITESPFAREKCSREIEDKSKENILPSTDEPCQVPSHKPTRRKLVESPLSQASATNPCAPRLDDSLSNEGVYPILYTPEICRAQPTQDACRMGEFRREGLTTNKEESPRLTGSGTPCATEDGTGCSSIPLNLTFNLTDDCGKADCDATVILSPGSSKLETALGSAALEQGQESSKGSSILQRLGLPSLLNNNNNKSARSGKPSYMGMTSAAERKRNLSRLQSDVLKR